MSDDNEVKFCMKVMLNKQKTKVLFAEVDSDFADVLLSFLTMPLGTIARVLKKHYGTRVNIGSLTSLYDGLSNLSSECFWTEGGHQMLLNPRSSFEAECLKLKLDISDTEQTQFFRCSDMDCKKKRSANVSMYYATMECDCGELLSKPMDLVTHEDKTEDEHEDVHEDEDDDEDEDEDEDWDEYMVEDEDEDNDKTEDWEELVDEDEDEDEDEDDYLNGDADEDYGIDDDDDDDDDAVDDGDDVVDDGNDVGGVFTAKQSSFLVTDDLKMAPNVQGSMIETLINLGIEVTEGAELMMVTLGFNEIMDLLKASLLSKTPLTDVILHQTNVMESVKWDSLLHQSSSSSNSMKITIKAMVQKSTNKLLFVQAEEDFVDFLFCLLTIPLGGVAYLLDSNTSLRNIDNLYTSVSKLIDEKYLSSLSTKNRLIKPELPHKYLSKNQIFPLTEQTTPMIYYFESSTATEKCYRMCFKDPKGGESYIKGPGKYIVTNDLNVSAFSKNFGRYIIKKMKIPSSDVKALKLQIGLEEALSILKESLVSASALEDALINPIFKEHPQQN